ncbi:MAG: metallophosphoesterase [Bacteroidota bacterium]
MMTRKKFLKNLSILSSAAALTGLYAWQVEPFWLEFVKQKMPIRNLPDQLIGKTLMQISDIHVGNRFDWQYIIDSFKKAQKLKPDFVVYTGDFVSYENEEQFEQLEEVLKSAVKGELGTVAILGNHDYGQNWKKEEVASTIVNLLESNNIKTLRNEQAIFNDLNFIGFDDLWGLNFRPELVMQDYNPQIANRKCCIVPQS